MTLGRSSSGAIKVKADGAAGLRAVSCGCCGSCDGCPTLENITGATSITIGGGLDGFILPSQTVSRTDPFIEYFGQVGNAGEAGSIQYNGRAFYNGYNGYYDQSIDFLCGATNEASFFTLDDFGFSSEDAVRVWFSIFKQDGVCKVSLNCNYLYNNFYVDPLLYGYGNGSKTIPLDDLIGSHSIPIVINDCAYYYYFDGGDDGYEVCTPRTSQAQITIS